MRLLLIICILLSSRLIAQNKTYSPGMTVEKTVSLEYYDTEYIFIENSSGESITLYFELVSVNLPEDWSATGCTSSQCYIKLPDYGMLSSIAPGEQVYISINLAVNEFAGDGEIRYAIKDHPMAETADTIAFVYHAEEAVEAEPQPWAKIQVAQNVLTVFLENETSESTLSLFDLQGNRVLYLPLEIITSASLATFAPGVYIAAVSNESGKQLVQKIAWYE